MNIMRSEQSVKCWLAGLEENLCALYLTGTLKQGVVEGLGKLLRSCRQGAVPAYEALECSPCGSC